MFLHPFLYISMKVIVRYYPPFDRITGVREETLDLPENVTTGEFLRYLSSRYPGLKEYVNLDSDERQMNRMLIVQNGEFLRIRDTVKEGLVMVLFPISGG